MTTPCPSDDQLAALASGTLDAVALEELEKHVDTCATCRQLVAVVSNGSAPTLKHTLSVLKPGQRLGRYEIERLIGAGGMGVLYVARDPQLGRRVALKLMRPAFGTEGGRVRLLREAQAMATLSHPNVVPVFDIGEADERVFVAMELVESGTLRDWMKQNHSWKELVQMFCAAGEGLAAAHAGGVVHRDFKPENVLIGKDGRPRVGDFGLARPELVAEEEAPLSAQPLMKVTQTGTMLGTPAYMSPEQLKGKPADARSDQYGFCVCLYEALAGQRPFPADTLEELRARVEGGMPPPPRDGLVPAHVWAAIARGLNPDPNERFPDLQSLLRVLRADLPVPARRKFSAPPRRVAAFGGVMAIAIGVSVAFASGSVRNPFRKRAVDIPFYTGPSKNLPSKDGAVLTVAEGHQLIFDILAVERVEIEDGTFADARIINDPRSELLLTGKSEGTTKLDVWNHIGVRSTYTVKVIANPESLPEAQPGSPIDTEIKVLVGSQKVLKIPRLRSFDVGASHLVKVRRIADSPEELLLVGMEPGTTSLIVWTNAGNRWVAQLTIEREGEQWAGKKAAERTSPDDVEATEFYSLKLGAQKVITFKDLENFEVDDPGIFTAKLLGNDQVLLVAQDVGTTRFTIKQRNGTYVRGELDVEPPEPTYSGEPNRITAQVSLGASQSKVFDVANLSRVAVGDPAICDVRTIGKSQLMLLGASEGTTTLLVWNADGKRTSTAVRVTRASSLPAITRSAGAPFDTVTPMLVGDQQVFDVKHVTQISIGDPELAEVKLVGDDQVLVVGSAMGTTTLWVWTAEGQRFSTELVIDEGGARDVSVVAQEDAFVEFPHIERIKGTDAALIDVNRDGNSLRITGKKSGRVTLQVFTGAGAPITVNVRVTPAVRELRSERLSLGPKDLVQFHLAGLERVAIGDPNVADVKVLDDDRIEVHGVRKGTTTLLAWMQDGSRRSWEIEIR